MRISDWSSDVCSSDLLRELLVAELEQRLRLLLLACDPRLAPALLVAEAQHLLGGVEQFGEQLPLPAVPHAGADRADIDDGDRKSVVEGKSVSVRVDPGGRRIIKN